MIYKLDNDYYVRPLRESDLEGPYPYWFEDQDVCKYNSHGKYFKNLKYFQDYINTLNSEKQVVWAICHASHKHIGNISIQNISFVNRNAELAIFLGDKEHWHKGVGYTASVKILSHGFYKLNLERIYCGTSANNDGMINLAKKLGMKEEGRRRSHIYLDNQWHDLIEFGILKQEFKCDSNMRS